MTSYDALIHSWTAELRTSLASDGLLDADPELVERLVLGYEPGARRLCELPLGDPFWYPSNMKPTPYKVQEYASRRLRDDPLDATAAWTLLAEGVRYGRHDDILQ